MQAKNRLHTIESTRKEMLDMEWKTPDFEEIEIRAEVTAYAATWPDWD